MEKDEIKMKLLYLSFFSTVTQPHSFLTSTGIEKNSLDTTKINTFKKKYYNHCTKAGVIFSF